MSGKAIAMKSLNEKWLSIVQSAEEKGEKEIGGSSTVTESPSGSSVGIARSGRGMQNSNRLSPVPHEISPAIARSPANPSEAGQT